MKRYSLSVCTRRLGKVQRTNGLREYSRNILRPRLQISQLFAAREAASNKSRFSRDSSIAKISFRGSMLGMDYAKQKEYFEQAYLTGSDIWTHIPYELRGRSVLEHVPKNSLILDIGSGRGMWAFALVELGYRVIGVDYVGRTIERTNEEAKHRAIEQRVRFVESDVLNMPFKDGTFDAATDFGLLQHLDQSDWKQYCDETARVIKDGGYFLAVVFSKETPSFLGWSPRASESGHFEKDGIHYHFFTRDEVARAFEAHFDVVEQKTEVVPKKDVPVFVSTVFKRKTHG